MIKKTWKKALAGLCAAVMMFSSVGPAAIESYAGTFTSGDETWLVDKNNNDMKVRLKVQYNGQTEIGSSGATVQMTGDMSSVFNGNTGDGVIFKGTTDGSEQNNILPGDYILVEFEELMNFNAVKVTFGDANDVFPTDVTLSYQTVDNQWVECETGNTGSTMKYLVFAGLDIRGAKAIKITAKTEKSAPNSPREWLKLNEIEITETKLLEEIDSKILADNAKANSEQWPAAHDNDGKAEWAFDDQEHWWHSRYQNWDQKGEHEIGSKNGDGKVSAGNPIWIQTGFGETKIVSKVTYLPRQDSSKGRIKDYELAVATVENPTDSDFTVVQSGTFGNNGNLKEIVFETPVEATFVRLVARSGYSGYIGNVDHGDGTIAVQNIKVYEKAPYATVKEKALLRSLIHEIESKLDLEPTIKEYSAEEVRDYVESAVTLLNNPDVTSKAVLEKITELEAIQFVTYRVDDAVLLANAKANSQQWPAAHDNDGKAEWAFDDQEHWWHSRYQNWDQKAEHEIGSSANDGKPSETNPVWIQTGFGESKYIDKITYMNRDGGRSASAINKYAIAVANLENPSAEPTDVDFKIMKAGSLSSSGNAGDQVIELDNVEATHIRLIAYEAHDKSYVVARRIKVWETNPEFVTETETTPVEEITLNQSGTVNLSAVEASAKAKSVAVTATVTPANASDTRVVWESSVPGVVEIKPSNNNVMVAEGNADGVVTSVKSNVVVKAVGEGTTTITAKSVSNDTVVASFEVNVTGYIHETVELTVGETYRTEPVTANIEVADETIATASNVPETLLCNKGSNEVNGDISMDKAVWKFTQVDSKWNIYNESTGLYFVNNSVNGKNVFGSAQAKDMTVDVVTNDTGTMESVQIWSPSGDNKRYVIYYGGGSKFDAVTVADTSRNDNNGSWVYSLKLLEKQETVSSTDVVAGWAYATELKDGGEYVIAHVSDANTFILYPQEAQSETATKVTKEVDNFEITGIAVGTTTVTVADKVYDVTVKEVAQFQEEAQFTEATASLTGTIGLNFYVKVNDTDELDNLTVKLTSEKAGSEPVEVALKELTAVRSGSRAGQYKVTFNVAAKEMTDKVTAEIYNAGNLVTSTKMSVKDYAGKLIDIVDAKETPTEKDLQLKDLLKAMLNYGAVAQHQFGYKDTEEGLPTLESLKGLYENTVINPEVDVDETGTNTAMSITRGEGFDTTKVDISQVSLLLKEDTVLRLYLNVASGVNMSEYTVTPELANGKKYAEVTGISAQNLEDRITFTITAPNNTVATVVYSPLDYAKAVVDSDKTNDTLKTVAKALYKYYVCAETYFN